MSLNSSKAGLHQKKDGQQGEAGDCTPLLPPGVLHPGLGSLAQISHKCRAFGTGPAESHKNTQRAGTPSCEERLRELGCSAWRRLWGDLSVLKGSL